MKNLLLSLALISIFSCTKNPYQETKKIQDLAAQVCQEFVPDKRVDIFDVEVENIDGKYIVKGATTLPQAKAAFLEQVEGQQIEIIDSIIILPEEQLGKDIYGVVTLSVASMRTSGKYSAEMATQALLGTPVKILQDGSWLRVQTPEGYISYTYAQNIKRMNKESFFDWSADEKIIFTDNYGFAYAKPKSNEFVSDLVVGNILKLDGESGDYYKVSYPDGREAYVKKSQSQKLEKWLNSIVLDGAKIVDYSKRFLGVPYLWGGTSAKMFDCSGFVKTVYFMHGIILARDASQQCKYGKAVDISEGYDNLELGDLLFFGTKTEGDKKERIGHVGIYIGDKQFIHEATQVKINSLDENERNYDEYNANRLIRASRIIGFADTKGISTIKSNYFYNPEQEFSLLIEL